MSYRLNNMAEFEALKNRTVETRTAPKRQQADNKYKPQIDLIFMALKKPTRFKLAEN